MSETERMRPALRRAWDMGWEAAEAFASSAPRPHWLLFDKDRQIVGCRCGFRADMDSDCGWGDSVVEHLLEVPR